MDKYVKSSAWFPASTRPRSVEGTGRQGSDLLTPGQKPAKFLKFLNPYLENRFCVVLLAGNKVIENMADIIFQTFVQTLFWTASVKPRPLSRK